MNLTRRDFLKDSLAALGFLALPGTPMFAAPVGWKLTIAVRPVSSLGTKC